jgi:pentatricopeptide repeat protein
MDWGPAAAWPDLPFTVNGTAVDGDIRAGWARLSQMGVGVGVGGAAAASAAKATKVIIQQGAAGAATATSAERAVRQIVRQGRLGKAVDLLVALSEEEGQRGVVDRALVNFVLFNCMKRRDWMRALTVLDAPTIEVDIVGFTMAIKACGQARRWKEALEVLGEMEARGVSPDLVSYNCAMDALGKAGQYDRALELFQEIERKGACVRAVSVCVLFVCVFVFGGWGEVFWVRSLVSGSGSIAFGGHARHRRTVLIPFPYTPPHPTPPHTNPKQASRRTWCRTTRPSTRAGGRGPSSGRTSCSTRCRSARGSSRTRCVLFGLPCSLLAAELLSCLSAHRPSQWDQWPHGTRD